MKNKVFLSKFSARKKWTGSWIRVRCHFQIDILSTFYSLLSFVTDFHLYLHFPISARFQTWCNLDWTNFESVSLSVVQGPSPSTKLDGSEGSQPHFLASLEPLNLAALHLVSPHVGLKHNSPALTTGPFQVQLLEFWSGMLRCVTAM